MKAVVTGISGFAGGYLAEHLLALGDEVLGIVRDPATSRVLPGVRRQAKLISWDIREPRVAPGIVSSVRAFDPDCVYHLAALSLPDDCGETDPTPECLAANVEGTRRVVELIRQLPRPSRLLFVSSSRVYAPVDSQHPRVAEDDPLGPIRGYGRSKLLAESLIGEAVETRGLDAVIVRAFQHTGPRQDGRLMLPEWSRQLAAESSTLEVRHLDAHIDCSDVRDVVRAYRLLAIAGKRGEAYNVGSGVSRRSGDVVEQLCALAGRRPRIVERSPGRKQDPIADIGRLVAATGWRSEVAWEQTLHDTLDDWRRRLAPSVASRNSWESKA